MTKAKRKNQMKSRTGKPLRPITTSGSNKPFIGNNVFTLEDLDIIRSYTDTNPDTWTIDGIKDVLPHSHTLKSIENSLLRLFPADVIQRHANIVNTSKPADAQPAEKHQTNVTPADVAASLKAKEEARQRAYTLDIMDSNLRALYQYLGPDFDGYDTLFHEMSGLDVTNAEVLDRARELGLEYLSPEWSADDDAFIIDCIDELKSDNDPMWYIYIGMFSVTCSKYQVLERFKEIENMPVTEVHALIDDTESVEAIEPSTHETHDNHEKENQTMQTTDTAAVPQDETDRELFQQLTNVLMDFSPAVMINVSVQLPDGLAINLRRDPDDGKAARA